MSANRRLALEVLAVADALRCVAQQIDRLDRAGCTAVTAGTESTVIHCNGPAVVEALESLAQRLGMEG